MKKMILGERKEQIEGLFSSAITISSNPIPRRSPTGHPTEHWNELDDVFPTYLVCEFFVGSSFKFQHQFDELFPVQSISWLISGISFPNLK